MVAGVAAATTSSQPAAPSALRTTELLAVGALALLLRAGWVVVYGRTAVGPNDTIFYEGAAASMSAGNGYTTVLGEPTGQWPPGFVFLVSLLYRVFGIHAELALGLNVVLGAATAVLLAVVAARMFGRTGGLVAGLAFAVLPGPLFMTGLFLVETTYIFLLVGFLALLGRLPDRRWTPLVLGVAVGLAALTKGEGLIMAVIPLAAWWGLPRREWLRRAALLGAALVLTVAPWTIRNAVVLDAFVPVATNASNTLWSGHNENATGGATYAPPELLARTREIDAHPEVAEARVLRRDAAAWAVRHPLQELVLIPRKLVALNNQTSNVFPIWFNAEGDRQLGDRSLLFFGVLGDVGGYVVLAATLASLLLLGARRLWRLDAVLRGVLAYLVACLVVFGFVYYGQWRYRLPMEPLMLLVATPLLVAAWERRGELRAAVPRSR